MTAPLQGIEQRNFKPPEVQLFLQSARTSICCHIYGKNNIDNDVKATYITSNYNTYFYERNIYKSYIKIMIYSFMAFAF